LAGGLCITFSLCVLFATSASARDESLRWTHPNPAEVVRFEALYRTSSQSYGNAITLGLPQPDAQGVYSGSITVPDTQDVYVAVRAVNAAGEASFLSNERFRPSAASGGEDPPPPPDPNADLATGTEIPAQAGALLRFDFDSGSAPNWHDTEATNSLVQNDGLFSVVDVGDNPALSTTSTSTNIHSHFVGSPSNLSNVRITGRMATDMADGGFGITAYSQYPSADVYYRLRTKGGGARFELAGHPAAPCNGNLDTGVTPQPNVWYEFEFSVTNESEGNRVSASIWKQGDPKPSQPQAECVDSTSNRPLAGTVGVWSMGVGGKFWDDLEVSPVSGATLPSGPPAPPLLLGIEAVN
jgi:hypothetical protein